MTDTAPNERLLRRSEAAEYLTKQKGCPTSKSKLDKLACLGGGPEMQFYGRWPLYRIPALDRWAEAQLSVPVTSTAERRAQAA
jgi:hypothetical protein